MSRFNPKLYDPVKEIGGDHPDLAYHPQFGSVVLLRQADPKFCPCGCNSLPSSRTSTFKMGHDARLKGVLIRAHITQTPVVYVTGDSTHPQAVSKPAMEWATRYEWESYLNEALDRQAAAPVRRSPSAPKPAAAELQVGDVRPVKVGRWSYLAKIIGINGTKVQVEYENASKMRKQASVARTAVGA